MSVPPVIDLDAILASVPGDHPAGTDPRENASGNSPYYRIKDARNAARAEERASIDAGALTPEAWDTVIETGVDILATKAKDLEIAAWLTEALIRVESFAGLRDGFRAITGLVETFWDELFPALDEDGVEGKVSSIAGLSGAGATGTLDRPIRNTPLTAGGDGAYSFWDYEQAVELEKITDDGRRAARREAGTITLETFRKSVADTPTQHLRDTLATINECEVALAKMSEALDQAAGVDAPSVTALQDLLSAVAGCVRHVASDRLVSQTFDAGGGPDEVDAGHGNAAPMSGQQSTAGKRPGEFGNREEALALLLLIAAYFRRTEPQAPISYTIEDAVRRARMTLPELLKELAQDPSHMQHILSVAGIGTQGLDE